MKNQERILELINQIPAMRVEKQSLIKAIETQAVEIERLPRWLTMTNRGDGQSVLQLATRGELNHGSAQFLRENFPENIEKIKTFGENALKLNQLSCDLEKLEKELQDDYKIALA